MELDGNATIATILWAVYAFNHNIKWLPNCLSNQISIALQMIKSLMGEIDELENLFEAFFFWEQFPENFRCSK